MSKIIENPALLEAQINKCHELHKTAEVLLKVLDAKDEKGNYINSTLNFFVLAPTTNHMDYLRDLFNCLAWAFKDINPYYQEFRWLSNNLSRTMGKFSYIVTTAEQVYKKLSYGYMKDGKPQNISLNTEEHIAKAEEFMSENMIPRYKSCYEALAKYLATNTLDKALAPEAIERIKEMKNITKADQSDEDNA